jgi:hypothetical protein
VVAPMPSGACIVPHPAPAPVRAWVPGIGCACSFTMGSVQRWYRPDAGDGGARPQHDRIAFLHLALMRRAGFSDLPSYAGRASLTCPHAPGGLL